MRYSLVSYTRAHLSSLSNIQLARPFIFLVGFVVLLSFKSSIRKLHLSQVGVSEYKSSRVASDNSDGFHDTTGIAIRSDNVQPVLGSSSQRKALPKSPSSYRHASAVKQHNIKVDILSVGSRTRPSYHEAQHSTFGSHSTVRNFVKVTEEVDSDATCPNALSWRSLMRVVLFCRGHYPRQSLITRRTVPASPASHWNQSFNASFNKEQQKRFVPLYKLLKKQNPIGWLCAQKRPIEGFVAYMQRYQQNTRRTQQLTVKDTSTGNGSISELDQTAYRYTAGEDIPDYLFIIDDDTYVNLPLVASEIQARFPSHGVHAVSGRLLGSHKFFPYPLGGLGVIFSRRVLENFIAPVRCDGAIVDTANSAAEDYFSEQVCAQINKNLIGEASLFREGMTILDLVQAYTTRYRYSDFQRWESPGYCMHSDWVWGFFFRAYPLANAVPHGGLRPYDAKSPLSGEAHHKSPYDSTLHDHTKAKCTAESHLCHYAHPEQMRSLFDESNKRSVLA